MLCSCLYICVCVVLVYLLLLKRHYLELLHACKRTFIFTWY